MIKDLRENSTIEDKFLVKDANVMVSAKGTNYLSLVLQDASGTIEAKKFDLKEKDVEILQAGNFVEIEGNTSLYLEKLQIIVRYASKLDENKIDFSYFVQTAPLSEKELSDNIASYINSIQNADCKSIVRAIFKKYWKKFLIHPAAVKNHHDYCGGLAYHTLTMCKVADSICNIYQDMNRDLLISGCLLHDIGKMVELSDAVLPKYTVEGKLLGHLVIGTEIIKQTAIELNIQGEIPLLLQHMIIAHHGKLEYGSAVLPQLKEAYALSMIDEMDAKLNAIDKALSNIEEGTFTERIFSLDNRVIYKPFKD